MELLEIVKAIDVMVASVVALYGIISWKKELRWKRKFELAEETLALFYEVRDIIIYMRMSASNEQEGTSRTPVEGELPFQKEARDSAFILIERYQKSQEAFNRLHALRYRFMAVFEISSSEPFDELRQIINRLILSARRLSRLWSRLELAVDKDDPEQQNRINKIREEEKIFWEHSEGDEINSRLNDVIEEIEKKCYPILSKRSFL